MNTERELAEVQTVTHMEHGDRLPYPYPMAGCKYTPEECAKILAERINQPHYVAHIVRRAIEHALLSRADGAEARDAEHWRKAAPFVAAVMENWWEGDLDGGTRQDLAEKHGLIAGTEVTGPCREEGCACEEYGFPTTCYKPNETLRAAMAKERGDG